MISNLLHTKSLGVAELYYPEGFDHRSNSGSRTSRGTTIPIANEPLIYQSMSEAKAKDPWGLFIVPFANGRYGIVVSDGVTNWNIIMDGTQTVEDSLHSIFSNYFVYDRLPVQREDGSYVSNISHKHGSTGSYEKKLWSTETGRAQMYNVALTNGTLRTLSEILASGNVLKKIFYIPYGYYYIGKDIKTSPVADLDAASGGKKAGDLYKANQEVEDVIDWIGDNDEESSPPAATTQPAQLSKKQKMLYALMAIGTVLYFTIDGDTKKKRKR